jgi:hypothetical protein
MARTMSWKSFLEGMARCVDIFGVLGPPVDLPKTDAEAKLEEAIRERDAALQDLLAAVREAQSDDYVMSEAEAAALRDPARRPRPTVRPRTLPKRDEQSVFLDPPELRGKK